MLILGGILFSLTLVEDVRAGVIVSNSPANVNSSAEGGMTAAPRDKPMLDDRADEIVFSALDGMTTGAGSSSGVNAPSGSPLALLTSRCIVPPQPLRSSSICQRSISLPDSPVFDRSRPPRA
jgi:hypothetical protein